MGMRRQKANCAGRRLRVGQYGMNVRDDFDLLEVPVCAGMEIGPGNMSRVRIVRHLIGGVRVEVARVEVVSLSNPAQRADRGPKVHVIASYQETAAAAAKPRYGGTVLRG